MAPFDTIPDSADHALFTGQISGLIVTVHENERPLCGLAGLMDWRFHGAISQFIRAGAIQGKPGECIYLPIARHGSTFHLFLVGGGSSSSPGKRQPLPSEAWKGLKRNLDSLHLKKIGISRSDLGNPTEQNLSQSFKGMSLAILP